MSVYDSNFETNRKVPLGAITTLRLVTMFERAIDAFVGWRNTRATQIALRKLSDEQLADIGIDRHQISGLAQELALK